ncbi:MAG: flagellar biosynthetic protein FliO [Candidatus Gastranaerophilales bacterium]|nr:flagellar biosynthetic protein FliO [Candidatus Gastranaerophilales bacterium]
MKKTAISVSALILCGSKVFAASTPAFLTEQMKQSMQHAPQLPNISNVLLSTLFMVVMIYVVAFMYQKISSFNSKKFTNAEDKSLNLNKMKIVSSMALGANKAVHIVEVNGKYLVLGSTASNISLLKEFDKKSLKNAEMFATSMGQTDVKPEDIEQGLNTIYPKEQEKIVVEPQKTDEDDGFNDVYKKYIN